MFWTGSWAWPAPTETANRRNRDASNRKPSNTLGNSVRRRVITSLGVDGKRGQALRRMEFDLNLAPTGVVRVVARSVSQYILVAQLHADLGRDIRQII